MAAAMTGTNGKSSGTATVKLTEGRSEEANVKVKAWFMEQNIAVAAGGYGLERHLRFTAQVLLRLCGVR